MDVGMIDTIEIARRILVRQLRHDLDVDIPSDHEARFLVNSYYMWQEVRKRSANQISALSVEKEPTRAISWVFEEGELLEKEIKRMLERYSDRSPIGQWSMSLVGIGPVISAGLLAHIDMHRAPTAGHLYSFGGWNPTMVWRPGEKRPYNASLKTLYWKIGDSFNKTKNNSRSVYGPVLIRAKERIVAANDRGDYADAAARTLSEVPHHKQASIYKQGRLPDGRVELRARRVAVKLFLSHWHSVAHWVVFGRPAPAPYPFAQLHHVDYIPVPNAHLVSGFTER